MIHPVAPTAGLATGHVGLNVTDLDRAAFLGDQERTLLTLWQQSDDAFADDRPGGADGHGQAPAGDFPTCGMFG